MGTWAHTRASFSRNSILLSEDIGGGEREGGREGGRRGREGGGGGREGGREGGEGGREEGGRGEGGREGGRGGGREGGGREGEGGRGEGGRGEGGRGREGGGGGREGGGRDGGGREGGGREGGGREGGGREGGGREGEGGGGRELRVTMLLASDATSQQKMKDGSRALSLMKSFSNRESGFNKEAMISSLIKESGPRPYQRNQVPFLTKGIRSPLCASTGIHGSQLAVQQESEPSIADTGQFYGTIFIPYVQAVSGAHKCPVPPLVRFVDDHFCGILHLYLLLLASDLRRGGGVT